MRSKTQSKFLRYIKSPIRVLARTRDLYMESLAAMGGSGHVSYGNALGCPTPQIPRSCSVNSGFRSADEQLRDLMRLAGKIEPERRGTTTGGAFSSLRRSNTVGFGRIDEDKAFEFGDDERVGLVYPRSKGYATSMLPWIQSTATICLVVCLSPLACLLLCFHVCCTSERYIWIWVQCYI